MVARQRGAKSAHPSPEVTLRGGQLCKAHTALSSNVCGPPQPAHDATGDQTPGHSSGCKRPDHGSLPLPPRAPSTLGRTFLKRTGPSGHGGSACLQAWSQEAVVMSTRGPAVLTLRGRKQPPGTRSDDKAEGQRKKQSRRLCLLSVGRDEHRLPHASSRAHVRTHGLCGQHGSSRTL